MIGGDPPRGQLARMDLFSGLALGALVGLLVGLSSTEVVGAVVTAILAVLVAFFGLQGSAGPLKAEASAARVAGFALAMAATLVLGVLARTHGWLQPTVAQRVSAYENAGFPADRARELALFAHAGLLTGSLSGQTAPDRPTPGSGMLFSEEAAADCTALAAEQFDTPDQRLQAMTDSGGAWERVAAAARAAPPPERAAIAQAGWRLACRPG